MLLDRANELGGSELVKKWIGLHVVGEKQDQIKKIALEAKYL
jgi:transketolase